jgi:hypothetical protein
MLRVIAAVAAVAVAVVATIVTTIVAVAAMAAAVAAVLLLLHAVVPLRPLPRAAPVLLRLVPVLPLPRLLPARPLLRRRLRRRPRRRSSLLTDNEAPPVCWRRLDCFDARRSQTADGWKTPLSLHLMKRLEAGSLLRPGFFLRAVQVRCYAKFLAD